MSNNIYILGILSNGEWLNFTVRGKLSLKRWLVSWSDLGYDLAVTKLNEKQVKQLNERTKKEIDIQQEISDNRAKLIKERDKQ